MTKAKLSPKGALRRELLLQAALDQLSTFPLESISLQQIAEAAGIPASSSYHFFGNAYDVFRVLAERFGTSLIESLTAPYPHESRTTWQQLYRTAVERGVAIYRGTPAYCQLILSPHTPPTIKLSDRKNDARLGKAFADVLDRYFVLYRPPGIEVKIFYSIEIVDLFLSFSYMYHQKLEDHMVEEGKVAAIAYLERYIPHILQPRSNQSNEH